MRGTLWPTGAPPRLRWNPSAAPVRGQQGWVVMGPRGAIDWSLDPNEVAQKADFYTRRAGGRAWAWEAPAPGAGERQANPAGPPARAPFAALAATGLVPVEAARVLSLSVAEAHLSVLPYLSMAVEQGKRALKYGKRKGQLREIGNARALYEARFVTTPDKGLLRGNFKTEKQGGKGRAPANILGLSLVPETSAYRGVAANGVPLPLPLTTADVSPPSRPLRELLKNPGDRIAKGKGTLCWGASKECMESCLVFTGNNQTDDRNVSLKQAWTLALLKEPHAFVRLLVEACRRFVLGARVQPYIRLNMLSDIPWELFVPWLFDLPELQGSPWGAQRHLFYDYTKVPGRTTPAHYDLTFSFSGDEINKEYCRYELARGRRIAVVFIPGADESGRYGPSFGATPGWRPWVAPTSVRTGPHKGKPTWYLPKSILLPWLAPQVLPVLDGDATDCRARDPGQCVVGLRWKKSKGRPQAQGVETFVIRGTLTPAVVDGRETQILIAGETGPSTGAEGGA